MRRVTAARTAVAALLALAAVAYIPLEGGWGDTSWARDVSNAISAAGVLLAAGALLHARVDEVRFRRLVCAVLVVVGVRALAAAA